jgi:hypothetical protein
VRCESPGRSHLTLHTGGSFHWRLDIQAENRTDAGYDLSESIKTINDPNFDAHDGQRME